MTPRVMTSRIARERWRLIDLDQRPELISATVAAFAGRGPGKQHLVTGFPWRMGLPANANDLMTCTGVLVACTTTEMLGALAVCPYSDEQVTLWGPAVPGETTASTVAAELVLQVRRHLRKAGFTSMRLLVDTRNRDLRAFALSNGFAAWKDNHVYHRQLRTAASGRLMAISTTVTAEVAPGEVRLATTKEHRPAATLLSNAFPESDQARAFAEGKDLERLRVYIITSETGQLEGAAVVDGGPNRGWLKLIAVRDGQRGHGLGRRLLHGVCNAETQRGTAVLGLEVLADNESANALYQRLGFVREWTATIMTAPL